MPAQSTPWGAPARAGGLSASEVEVWRLDLCQPSAVIALLFEQLSGEERARARRFRRASDYEAYVLTRGVLRQLLGAYMGRADDGHTGSVELIRGAYGKPKVVHAPGDGDAHSGGALEFSVSHAAGYALLGFGRSGPLGVDIEALSMRRDIALIVEHHFAPAEAVAFRRAAQGLLAQARYRLFYRYWTRKEAYIKALGRGMSVDLQSFAVGLEPGAPLGWSARGDAADWRFDAMDPGADYIGALCCSRATSYLRTMTATVSNSASVQLVL